MSPEQTRIEIGLYNAYPHLFQPHQVAELEKNAVNHGFIEPPKNNQRTGMIGQAVSGFFEGALGPFAFGGFAEDPQSETESIAHSAGHLLGFALPLFGSIVTGGGSLLARGAIAGGARIEGGKVVGNIVTRNVLKGAGKLDTAGQFLKSQKSIPMRAGDFVTKNVLAKAGFEASKYLEKGRKIGTTAKMVDMGVQGANLAVASTVSGLFNGEDDEWNNLFFGAVAGGFFGGLGNFVNIGKAVKHPNPVVMEGGQQSLYKYSKELSQTLWANRQKWMTALGGSAFQGGMATLSGAPTATMIYEFGLGAFFGYQAHGVKHAEASKFFTKFSTEKMEDGVTPKYNENDQFTMLKDPSFKDLSKEAQALVKESFTNHIGELWEFRTNPKYYDKADPISVAGIKIAQELKPALESALKRKSVEVKKKVEDLESWQRAEVMGEVLESVPREFWADVAKKTLENDIIKTLNDPDLQLKGGLKEITDRMSSKEIADVKKGFTDPLTKAIKDYFDKLPPEELRVTTKDILEASEKLSNEQAELEINPMIRRGLIETEKLAVGQNIDPVKLISLVGEKFNEIELRRRDGEITKADDAYKEIFDAVKKKYKAFTPSAELENGFIHVFKRLEHNVTRPILSLNLAQGNGKVNRIFGMTANGKKVTEVEPRSADEAWLGNNVKIISFSEVVQKGKRGSLELKNIYDTNYNFETQSHEPVLKLKDWLNVTETLHKRNEYLKIPEKDKGFERIYEYHPDINKRTLKSVLEEIAKKKNIDYKDAKKFFERDYVEWLDTMDAFRGWGSKGNKNRVKDIEDAYPKLKQYYTDAFKSNYLYEPNFNFPSPQGRIKREPLISKKGFYPLSKGSYDKLTKGTNEINYIVLEAEQTLLGKLQTFMSGSKKNLETYDTYDDKGNIVTKAWGSKIDGWMVSHSDFYKQMEVSEGYNGVEVSHLKPAVAHKFDNGELFLLKGGMHPGSKKYDDALPDKNWKFVTTSATKSFPKGTRIYKAKMENGKFKIYDLKGNKALNTKDLTPSITTPVESFGLNPGVYGDNHSGKPTTIKKQIHTYIDDLLMSPTAYRSFMDAMLEMPVQGDPKVMEYYNTLKEKPNEPLPKNFDISKISDEAFTEIINNPNHQLHKMLNMDIFRSLKEMELGEEFSASKMYGELREYANNFEQWYKSSGYNPVSAIINQSLYEKSVHIYRMKRFTNPKWKNSASGWVAGVDPVMEYETGGIKKNKQYRFWDGKKLEKRKVGHFKLGYSHENMEIKWIRGEEIGLGKAWEEYKTALAEINKPIKERKYSSQQRGSMREKLLMAVMRVPANAISGTRALMFDGFVRNDVGLNNWGVYMRARDHFYIDGADVDGDKVFFYQGLPYKYMRELNNHDAFLERKTPEGKTVFFENKAEKLNDTFESGFDKVNELEGVTEWQYFKENPISQWGPGGLRRAGLSSYTGKKGLGSVVNAKQFLNTVLADVINNYKGKIDLPVKNKKGELVGYLIGQTSRNQLYAPEGYYVMGTEAHSRTADSANYPKMANAEKMTDIIFQSAFEKINFVDNYGGEHPAQFRHIKNTSLYGNLWKLNNRLYGWNYEEGRSYDITEIQNAVSRYVNKPDMSSSLVEIAHHMAQNKVDTDPTRFFNYNKQGEAIRMLSELVVNQPDVLPLIARQNLRVMQSYYNIDYKEVYKVFNKKHPDYEAFNPSNGELKKLRKVNEDNPNKEELGPYRNLIWEATTYDDGVSKLVQRYTDMGKAKEGKLIQKTFDSIFSQDRLSPYYRAYPIMRHSAQIEKEYRINDSYDIWSALQIMAKGSRVKQDIQDSMGKTDLQSRGAKVPSEDIVRIANEMASGVGREELSRDDRMLYNKWLPQIEKAKQYIFEGTPEKITTRQENPWITFRDLITRHAESVKVRFKHDLKHGNEPVFRNMQEVNNTIREDVKIISERAKALKIDPRGAVDYYYNYLLGSLAPQQVRKPSLLKQIDNRIATWQKMGRDDMARQEYFAKDYHTQNYDNTSTPRFLWTAEAIPNAVKTEFMKGYADLFDLMNTVKPEKLPERAKEYVTFEKAKEDIEIGKVESRTDANEVHMVEIDRLFTGNKNWGIELDTPVKPDGRTKQLKDIPRDIPQVLRNISNTLETLGDNAILRVEDMYTSFKAQQEGAKSTSIRMATFDDIRSFNRYLNEQVSRITPKDQQLGFMRKFLFPDTIGEKMAGHDLSRLWKMEIPVRNAKGYGMATVSVPVSTMTFLSRSGGLSREIEDAVKNSYQEELFSTISVKGEIEALNNGIKTYADLYELAIKRKELDGAKSAKQAKFYAKQWKDAESKYNEYKGKSYRINRDGKIVDRTTDELMDDIIKQSNNFTNDFYQRFLTAGLLDTKSDEWTPINWNTIENNPKLYEKGMDIHEFVRYDKYGRFDVDNFNQKVMKDLETFGRNNLMKKIGKRDNPLSVDLLNKVQYEITLEESMPRNTDPTSQTAIDYRKQYREESPYKQIGYIKNYHPHIGHDRKKLAPIIKQEQQKLHTSLKNYVTDLHKNGKRVNDNAYEIPQRYMFRHQEIKDMLFGGSRKYIESRYPDIEYVANKVTLRKRIADRLVKEKLELQRGDFEMRVANRVESAVPQTDEVVNWLNSKYDDATKDWKKYEADSRPGTGMSRGEEPVPFYSYSPNVLEIYANQWVGSFFRNLNALNFRKHINLYEQNNIYGKESPVADKWIVEMKSYASSLLGRPMSIPKKYVGLSIAERKLLQLKIDGNRKINPDLTKRYQQRLDYDTRGKKENGLYWDPKKPIKSFFTSIEYRMSDQNMIDYFEAKTMGLNKWLIPGVSKKLYGTPKDPYFQFRGVKKQLPTSKRARQKYLYEFLTNIGAFESKWSLISLLAHPKTYMGNILGGSSNTITLNGVRNFKKARDTQWLISNVFQGAKLKDGTPIRNREDIKRWVAEVGAVESFYINEAMMDRRVDSKTMIPFIKEVFARERVGDKVPIKDLMKKYNVTESFVNLGGQFMRSSERTLRTDAFLAHYLHARETLGNIMPNMPFDHPYLTGMALKGIEATQFLYHNVNRPAISRSSMGKIMTRFQPFMWNSIRFRREIFKQAKIHGFKDQASLNRLKRLGTLDLMTMALAQVFVGSIFDSILPPPMSYIQDTADWLFGDEQARERAFFSSYPFNFMAPLQTVTAPVHRLYIPAITAMINGEWDRYLDFYFKTLLPFGRLQRNLAMTFERPEMFPEFMLGIPVHRLGDKIRKNMEDE